MHILFSPSGYNLPLEYTKLAAECSRNISVMKKGYEIDNHHNPIWICKPAARSQGKGIFLFKVRIRFLRAILLEKL